MSQTAQENSPVTFDPIFTKDQIHEFEQKYNSVWGTKRRLIMLTLSRSSDELLTSLDNDDGIELITELLEQALDYGEHLKAGQTLIDTLTARLAAISNQLGLLNFPSEISNEA